jgi:hypothetical protein
MDLCTPIEKSTDHTFSASSFHVKYAKAKSFDILLKGGCNQAIVLASFINPLKEQRIQWNSNIALTRLMWNRHIPDKPCCTEHILMISFSVTCK